MYNRRLRKRKFKRNPNTPSVYQGYDPEQPEEIIYFKSATAARAYLIKNDIPSEEFDRLDDDIPEQKLLKIKILDARKTIEKADKRNLRRQVQSLAGIGKTPRSQTYTPEEILRYRRIAEQMLILGIRLGQFAAWCGIIKPVGSLNRPADPEELNRYAAQMDALNAVFCEVVAEKCREVAEKIERDPKTLLWEAGVADACADVELCDGRRAAVRRTTTPPPSFKARRHNSVRRRHNPDPLRRFSWEHHGSRRFKKYPTPTGAELIAGIPQEKLHKWEEVIDEKGNVIRFRVDRYKSKEREGEMKQVVRDGSEPKIGDIILDLTAGAHAVQKTKKGRVPVKMDPEMDQRYKKSFLYLVRLVAAGKLSSKNFLKRVRELIYPPRMKGKRRNKKKLKRRKR